MKRTITATYRDGVFYPDEPCDLPEGATVEIRELLGEAIPAFIEDPEERKRNLKAVADRMRQNQFSPDAPSLTRDELHERR
ncbi:MAG: antitoxin family protein [Dehalococcoidia bacterium]|nr:antitoxin family protein [Dehalococcoidia bacterium]